MSTRNMANVPSVTIKYEYRVQLAVLLHVALAMIHLLLTSSSPGFSSQRSFCCRVNLATCSAGSSNPFNKCRERERPVVGCRTPIYTRPRSRLRCYHGSVVGCYAQQSFCIINSTLNRTQLHHTRCRGIQDTADCRTYDTYTCTTNLYGNTRGTGRRTK